MEQLQHSDDLSPSTGGAARSCVPLLIAAAVAVIVIAGGALLWLRAGSDVPNVPIPTLGLTPAGAARPSLAARLLGSRGGVDVHYFDRNEANTGFAALADNNILFTCPDDTVPGVRVETAHGDPALFDNVRYWGYEYTMNELANERAGRRDRELFDGRFWLADGELAESGDLYRRLNTPNMEMAGGKLYYLMLDGQTLDGRPFYVSCFDRDRDGLNDRLEVALGTNPADADSDDDGIVDSSEVTGTAGIRTNPANADTDGDELQDGTELSRTTTVTPDTNAAIFIPDADPATMTDPTNPDSDGGGVSDGAEDANHNGRVDAGETDPNDPGDDRKQCSDAVDNDGDGLVDAADPGCYVSGNIVTGAYDPNDNDETHVSACGNGAMDQASEQCDDGNAANGDGCSSACAITTQCSDGVDNADPEDTLADQTDPGCYDNGNIVTGTYNANDDNETNVPTCGNGAIDQGSEQCDDGNAANGDGCSSICAIEEGWQCAGSPSECDLVIPSTECTTTDCRIERLLDANGDGVTMLPEALSRAREMLALLNRIATEVPPYQPTPEEIALFDVSGDGVIVNADYLAVSNYINVHLFDFVCSVNDCRIQRLLDQNLDGTITVAEAAARHQELINHIGGTTPEELRLYDVNASGSIAPNDSLLVGSYRNSHGLM